MNKLNRLDKLLLGVVFASLVGISTLFASPPGAPPVLSVPGQGTTITGFGPGASNTAEVVADTAATKTAGLLLDVRNNGVSKYAVDFNGKLVAPCATTKAAVAASCGTAALDTSGTVTIATTAVTANSLIDVQMLTIGGTAGGIYRAAPADITAGTSFIIRSFVASTAGAATAATSDTSTVFWQVVN